MLWLVLLSLLVICDAFRFPASNFVTRSRHRSTSQFKLDSERMSFLDSSFLLLENDPKYEPMKIYSMILSNVTDHLENPSVARQIVGTYMPWLMSQDVPKLTELMLETIPALRKDNIMCLGYDFLMESIFSITENTAKLYAESELLLREVLAASAISSQELDTVINQKLDMLSSLPFLQFLDSEIQDCEAGSHRKDLLSVLKLRIVEEQGKRMSVDDRAIAELCVLDNSDERRMLVREFLEGKSDDDKRRFYGRVVGLLKDMEQSSAGNVSVYGNARDLEAILRATIYEN